VKEAVTGSLTVSPGTVDLTLSEEDDRQRSFSELDKFRNEIYEKVLNELNIAGSGHEISDEELEKKALTLLHKLFASGNEHNFSPDEIQNIQIEIIQDLLHLGPLEPLIADDDITEIMVVDYKRIYMEKKGKIELSKRTFKSPEHLLTVIERIVSPIGRRIDESSPLVDARLADGSRVNAVIPPIVPDGACLTIRKFGKDVFTVERLLEYGSLTENMAYFLEKCVQGRKNIVVSGGTGSGKTSLLNAISLFIGKSERIVTIEDSLELKLQQDHVVRMEARPPNAEGRGEVTIRRLVKNSLRMRPDRIVIGECRGGEALDMLQAMNTGHDGSLTTVHANSPKAAVSRLETLVLMSGMDLPLSAIQNQICSAVNIIVQTSRLSDGTRKVVSITEVTGLKDGVPQLRELFTFRKEGIDTNAGNKVVGTHVPLCKPTFFEEFKRGGIELKEEWFK
jgi:pilus assembly protein CpaF